MNRDAALLEVVETGSTNDDLRALADAGAPHGTAILAESQTAGRGRLGRVWEVPPGSAVLLSILLRPVLAARDVPLLCLAAAVATADACGPSFAIKWPNDVLAPDGRKVAGILAEMELSKQGVRHVVIGIGVNVTAAPPLSTSACLAEFIDPPNRLHLAKALVDGVLSRAEQVATAPRDMLDQWRARSHTLGRRVAIGAVSGLALDVEASGALLVQGDDGVVRRVLAGDVRMIGSNP